MAQIIPPETFAELEALAKGLLDRARELTRGHALVAHDTSPEEIALTEEVQAYTNAAMALNRITPLQEPAMFVAMGASVGVILAQSLAPHADLLRLMRIQEKSSYDEVVRASQPATSTMQ